MMWKRFSIWIVILWFWEIFRNFGIQICPAVVQLVLKILVRTKTNVMNGFITTDRILILMPVCSLST